MEDKRQCLLQPILQPLVQHHTLSLMYQMGMDPLEARCRR